MSTLSRKTRRKRARQAKRRETVIVAQGHAEPIPSWIQDRPVDKNGWLTFEAYSRVVVLKEKAMGQATLREKATPDLEAEESYLIDLAADDED